MQESNFKGPRKWKQEYLNPKSLLYMTRCLKPMTSGANYQLKTGNAVKIADESQHFDLPVNSYMFDLIAFNEMDSVLAEFKRVLKKDGKLILANMTIGETFGSGIYSWIYRASPKLCGGYRGVRLSEKLQQNGFQVITREYHQQLLFPSEVILASNICKKEWAPVVHETNSAHFKYLKIWSI